MAVVPVPKHLKPYLHDNVKTFLASEAEKARMLLRRRYPRWRLLSDSYTVRVCRSEVVLGLPLKRWWEPSPIRFADVAWVLEHREKGSDHLVLFEVKTGSFSEKWLSQLLEQRSGAFTAKEIARWLGGKGCNPQITFAVLVAWKRELERFLQAAEKDPLLSHYVAHGYIRGVELEIFLPFVRDRIVKLAEALNGGFSD